MNPYPVLQFLLFTILAIQPIAESVPTFFPRPSYQSLDSKLKISTLYKTHFFPQVLDHFTFQPKSYKIFYQKYLINSHYWHRGDPIFVYTGNEGDIEWFAANTGFLLDIAPKFNALLLFIEHRFYGESRPFGKDSYKSAETLGYLNSQQALADFAVLIRSLKHNLSSEASPVVVFGGSYGGMLAAWFRLKYPHIAIGALASSAPILQFDNITPWSSFYDAVSQDFKDASLNCYQVIKGSWDELEALSAMKEGLTELTKTFKACSGLHSIDSVWDWLWSAFVYTAMVNYPTEANFMKPLPAYPVQEMCKIIDGFPHGASKINKVFAAASLYYNYSSAEKCFKLENEKDDHGLSGWNWQACTEMVMPMACSKESMFPASGYSYKEFAADCKKKFGIMPRPHWITTEFGGRIWSGAVSIDEGDGQRRRDLHSLSPKRRAKTMAAARGRPFIRTANRLFSSSTGNNHAQTHKYLDRNSYIGSWEVPKTPREAETKLKMLRREYAKQVKELRKEYIMEMEAMRLEKQRKEEARKEALRVANEEKRKLKAEAAKVRAEERKIAYEE